METEAIITYMMCADVAKDLKIKDDSQVKMNTAEVMTTAIIAGFEYGGNLEKARKRLKKPRYIPGMLSKSQLNRRLHKIDQKVWAKILGKIIEEFKKHNISKEFIADSFPVPVCKNVRMNRSKIYHDKKYTGYCAAKKEFFHGVKVHMVSNIAGNPIEFKIAPGAESDIRNFKKLELNLPETAVIYADKAYNDYAYEDYLIQKRNIHLIPMRKKNSKRHGSLEREIILKKKRKIIETTFSSIEKFMPRSIHAVTKAGFELKIILFILAYAFSKVVF